MGSKGINIKERMAKVGILVGSILTIGLMLACAPPPPVAPIIPPKFSFTPPSDNTKKTNIVLAIVAPNYNAEKIKNIAGGFYTTEVSQRMTNIVNTFNKSMASDFEKIIVARGFSITGPFSSLDDMTHPDKKDSNLTLSPTINITANCMNCNESAGAFGVREGTGTFTISGSIDLIMLEPLSGEKMWKKKIEIEPVSAGYGFYVQVNAENRIFSSRTDTRPEAIRTILEQIYPKAMETVWRYLNTEEIINLNKEANDIRTRKRY